MGFTKSEFEKLCSRLGISKEMKPYFLKTVKALEMYEELDCGGNIALKVLRERVFSQKKRGEKNVVDESSVKKFPSRSEQDYYLVCDSIYSGKVLRKRHYSLRLRNEGFGPMLLMKLSIEDNKKRIESNVYTVFKKENGLICQLGIEEKDGYHTLKPLNDPSQMAVLSLVNQSFTKEDIVK